MDGSEPSYSRCASGFIVMAVIGWVTYAIVHSHGQIPDLGSPALFLSTGVGAHYGSNKLPDILSVFKKA